MLGHVGGWQFGLVHQDVIDVSRDGCCDPRVLCDRQVQHSLHDRRRDIQTEAESRQSQPPPSEPDSLVRPESLLHVDLQERLLQVQQSHGRPHLPPPAQPLCANVRIRRECCYVSIQGPEIEYWSHFRLLHHRHQRNRSLGRAQPPLVVVAQPAVPDPAVELRLILGARLRRHWVLVHRTEQLTRRAALCPLPRHHPTPPNWVKSHTEALFLGAQFSRLLRPFRSGRALHTHLLTAESHVRGRANRHSPQSLNGIHPDDNSEPEWLLPDHQSTHDHCLAAWHHELNITGARTFKLLATHGHNTRRTPPPLTAHRPVHHSPRAARVDQRSAKCSLDTQFPHWERAGKMAESREEAGAGAPSRCPFGHWAATWPHSRQR